MSLKVISILYAFSSVVFHIYGPSHSPSASAELFVCLCGCLPLYLFSLSSKVRVSYVGKTTFVQNYTDHGLPKMNAGYLAGIKDSHLLHLQYFS